MPPFVWVPLSVTTLVASGYFIRLLWSFNDYWRTKLGDTATKARLAPDWLWSYVWLIAAAVIFGIIFAWLVLLGVAEEPETSKTDLCYERLYEKSEEVDSLADEVAMLQESNNDQAAGATLKALDRTSVQYGRLTVKCFQLENEEFTN